MNLIQEHENSNQISRFNNICYSKGTSPNMYVKLNLSEGNEKGEGDQILDVESDSEDEFVNSHIGL